MSDWNDNYFLIGVLILGGLMLAVMIWFFGF